MLEEDTVGPEMYSVLGCPQEHCVVKICMTACLSSYTFAVGSKGDSLVESSLSGKIGKLLLTSGLVEVEDTCKLLVNEILCGSSIKQVILRTFQ